MPEGPSIVLLKEAAMPFEHHKVLKATGTADIALKRLDNQTVKAFKTWGKHFLICFKDFTIQIHLMMFGTYRVNEAKQVKPKLGLKFKNGELNFYTCKVNLIEGDLDEVYDWSADVMSHSWSGAKAKAKLKDKPKLMICDALLDQQIFSGVGNIIKNEALFNAKIHPQSLVGDIPIKQMNGLFKELVSFSKHFLKWKRSNVLDDHLEAYGQKVCPRDDVPFKKQYIGKGKRATYYCDHCQELYK